MPETAEILLDRIDRKLRELGKTRYWLAKAVTDGKNTGLITDLARKGYLPKEPRLRRIAELLGVSVDWLMGRTDRQSAVASEVGVADRRIEWHGPEPGEPGIPLVGTGDCASLEVSDESGRMVEIEQSSFDPDYHVRYLQRPPALRGAKDIYAIYFHGESMVPRFKPGELGLVDPRRPVAPGDDVVVQLREAGSDDVASVIVKELVRQSASEVTLLQHNPRTVFTLPRSRIVRIHRIVPRTELLI